MMMMMGEECEEEGEKEEGGGEVVARCYHQEDTYFIKIPYPPIVDPSPGI